MVSNPQTKGNDLEISFLIYIATAALAIIAYTEFHRANQLNSNELLTFISNRWSSEEIIKARQIIHEIFVSKYRYDQTNKSDKPEEKFKTAMENTSNDIYELSKKIGDDGKKFVYLLNLLDHFESISYLCTFNQIDINDINDIKNIYGNNVIFYYEAFQSYIKQRQSHKSFDFCNYTKIYSTLKESGNKRSKN